MRKCFHEIQLEGISQLVIAGRFQQMIGGAVPRLVVLGSIRKQAEQARGSKPVGSTFHGLSISSCLQVPALTSSSEEHQCGSVSQRNPFLPNFAVW